MIKILKNNLKLVVVFVMLGGLIAAGVVAARPDEYRGDFVIYLNKAAPAKESTQNYNDFYALQSLSQVADFLVEWSKKFDTDQPEFDLKLKKRTAVFLEGIISSSDSETTQKFFNEFVNSATQHISYFNNSIFSESYVGVSFSDFKIAEIKTNFWRWIFAGFFAGFILGIFAVFLRFYFKN